MSSSSSSSSEPTCIDEKAVKNVLSEAVKTVNNDLGIASVSGELGKVTGKRKFIEFNKDKEIINELGEELSKSVENSRAQTRQSSQNDDNMIAETEDTTTNLNISKEIEKETNQTKEINGATVYGIKLGDAIYANAGPLLGTATYTALMNSPSVRLVLLELLKRFGVVISTIIIFSLITTLQKRKFDETIDNTKNFLQIRYKESVITVNKIADLGITLIRPVIDIYEGVHSGIRSIKDQLFLTTEMKKVEDLRDKLLMESYITSITYLIEGSKSLSANVKFELSNSLTTKISEKPPKNIKDLNTIVSDVIKEFSEDQLPNDLIDAINKEIGKSEYQENCIGGGVSSSSSSMYMPGGKSRKNKSKRKVSKSGKKTRKSKKSNKRKSSRK